MEVPVVKIQKVQDPAELLSCQAWPTRGADMTDDASSVDTLVSLIAKGKEAWADCFSKIGSIKKFQDLQIQTP